MFGEKEILGHEEGIVDNNHRIIIPSFTEVEKVDELVLIEDNDDFCIYEKNYYLKKISNLIECMNASKVQNKRKELRRCIRFLSSSIIDSFCCDNERRVSIHTDYSGKVLILGCKDHIKIKKLEKNNNE